MIDNRNNKVKIKIKLYEIVIIYGNSIIKEYNKFKI
jgi:hypothetical protein